MGFLGLFGGKKSSGSAAVEAPPCLHAVLVPRWDSVADMGVLAKATSFMCDNCHQEFTPAEAEGMRTKLADVLVGQELTTDQAKAEIESSEQST